tara:strand:+ start:348 stop:563 length:216 start_codon:yes stop_codon:yes gene_type:complete
MRITLVPAYGRDYKSEKELVHAFNENLDFKIQDISCQWDGRYAGKRELSEFGYKEANIRYKKLSNVAVVKL